MAPGDALSRDRSRVPEGLARAAGARLEPPRPAVTRRAHQPRVARCVARGNRAGARPARPRHPARRARHARHDVQRGRDPRPCVGYHRRTPRAQRLDREMAAPAGARREEERTMSILTERPPATRGEQSRARYPDQEGDVERNGVRIHYEVYGDGEPTILFLPAWSIVHSRVWQMQIPYFARHARGVTLDGRGNGRSDRPEEPSAYAAPEFAADTLAVMDATATGRAFLVAESAGARWALLLAAEHPERVQGGVFIGPRVPLGTPLVERAKPFDAVLPVYEGWDKYNRNYWMQDHRGFLEFFFGKAFNEPHSTKAIEDAVSWGLEMIPETLIATQVRDFNGDTARSLSAQIRCPVLIIQGTDDAITGPSRGVALAEATGGTLTMLA